MFNARYKIPRFRPGLSDRSIAGVLKGAFRGSLAADNEKNIRRFEEAFAGYSGVKHAVSVPSGRMGLFLILKHLGIEKKSRVSLSAFNYWAVPAMVRFLDLSPVFTDISPEGYGPELSQLDKNIDMSTRAIIATHLYGSPCDMDGIIAVAKRHGIPVIEDCVQACGAEYKGRKAGSLGEAAYFSFGITKNMFLLNGGVVITNNGQLASRIREEVSGYGFLNRKQVIKRAITAQAFKVFTRPGVFSFSLFPFIRLSRFFGKDIVGEAFEEKERSFKGLPEIYFRSVPGNILADLGFDQLTDLDRINDKRIENASWLLENIEKRGKISLPRLPVAGVKNIFTNFPVKSENRDLFAGALLRMGIDTSYGYMKAFGRDCPNAAAAEREILHIPVYPSLNKNELSYISRAINWINERIMI